MSSLPESRMNIGIFGKMNAGKSSLMNLMTQQETSIVDSTAGTTTDTKIALMEIHGLGPVKIFDTAGLDEGGLLGEKKRTKTIAALKESDLAIVVIDPDTDGFSYEEKILLMAREEGKQAIIVYNRFSDSDPMEKIQTIGRRNQLFSVTDSICIKANDDSYRNELIGFILKNFEAGQADTKLLPFIEPDEFYILNIPMDDETPKGRYLRPQAMVEEYLTRHWAYPVSYRMDLKKARSKDPVERKQEEERFFKFLDTFKKIPKAIITDSQAMDVVGRIAPEEIMLTTFSIAMINFQTGGKLAMFARNIKALGTLKAGDKVLIAEACNHSRISEDIGTIQIPKIFKDKYPGVIVEHCFGRELYDVKDLRMFKLIIHCGGCMISKQAIQARVRDMISIAVPFTNYGLFLAYMQGEEVFARVLEPWGVHG